MTTAVPVINKSTTFKILCKEECKRESHEKEGGKRKLPGRNHPESRIKIRWYKGENPKRLGNVMKFIEHVPIT